MAYFPNPISAHSIMQTTVPGSHMPNFGIVIKFCFSECLDTLCPNFYLNSTVPGSIMPDFRIIIIKFLFY